MINYIKPSKGVLTRKESNLFRKIVRQFTPDFFQVTDGFLLEQYCRAYFRLEENYRLLNEEGEVTKGQRASRKNPRLQVIKTYTDIMAMVSVKLRLTAQQRKLPQHVNPSMNKVKDGKVYNPSNTNWRDFQNKEDDEGKKH